MSSLKSFKHIMEIYGNTNKLEGTYDDFLKIKKDLEILDLIKKHKHIFLYAIFINQNNYCGQENTELEKRDKFKEEINKIKEYFDDK